MLNRRNKGLTANVMFKVLQLVLLDFVWDLLLNCGYNF